MSATSVSPPPVPARRPARRGMGTLPDMLRSLLVCGAFVAAVALLFFTSSGGDHRPPADVRAATQQASAAGLPVAVPGLPSSWRATSARYGPDTTQGLPTWHVGYVTAAERDASADVTRGATPEWVAGVVGGTPDQPSGAVRVVNGRAWSTQSVSVDGSSVRAMVLTQGAWTAVVSGHATWTELDLLAAQVDAQIGRHEHHRVG